MTPKIKTTQEPFEKYTKRQISEIYRKTPLPTYLWQYSQDNDFILVDCNEAASQITKGGIQNYIGKRMKEMYKDDPQVIQDFFTCYHDRNSINREMLYFFHTLGEERYLSVTYSFIPKDIILVHTEDITLRKKAEDKSEKYQSIMENANIAAAILNTEGTLLYVNKYCAEVHGYTIDEIIGKSISIFHNDEQYKLARNLISQVEKLSPILAQKVWHTHKNGSVFPMLMNAIVIHDKKNNTKYLAASSINISEQVKAQSKQRKFARKLADAEKQASFGQFTAWLAHEINNPLHIILGKLYLIEKKLAKAEIDANSHTLKIKEQIDRISQLAKSMLNSSTPYTPDFKVIEIKHVMQNVLELLSENIPDSVHLHVSCSQKDLKVQSDLVHLELVFKNIILNAIESFDDGGDINILCDKHDDKTIVVHIRDNGNGIPGNAINRLFEPFYSTKRKLGGTGLGLPICKYIVELHGGKIKVESVLKQGTAFSIFLPSSCDTI